MDLIPYTFESCRDFLESPHFLNSSCIIADVQMPGMSGVELQAMLRSRGLTTPMIFITAYPDDRLRKRALDAGAVGFLHKPFQGTVIIECIERALGKSTGIPPSRR